LKKKLSLAQSLLWILCITIVLNGGAIFFILYSKKELSKKQALGNYVINSLIQEGPVSESLKSVYLQEALGLSVDKDKNIYLYDLKEARDSLLKLPVIDFVFLKKEFPSSLFVSYSLRQPIAYLGDFEDLFVDSQQVPIPQQPFYSPKKLPEIYLNDEKEDVVWHHPLKGAKWYQAYFLLNFINEIGFGSDLQSIDMRNYQHENFGAQQIVLVFKHFLEDKDKLVYLRLPCKKTEVFLKKFLLMKEQVLEMSSSQDIVIDLRFEDTYLVAPS
jgi:hypothetical protein